MWEPLLDKGDVIIDGGNTNFVDSIRRTKELEEQGFLFVGTGVSGLDTQPQGRSAAPNVAWGSPLAILELS